MITARSRLSNARRWLPVRLALALPIMLAILAACSPGSGKGPTY